MKEKIHCTEDLDKQTEYRLSLMKRNINDKGSIHDKNSLRRWDKSIIAAVDIPMPLLLIRRTRKQETTKI